MGHSAGQQYSTRARKPSQRQLPTVTVNAQEGSQTCIQVSIVRKNLPDVRQPRHRLCGQAARSDHSLATPAGHATLALRIASDVRPAAANSPNGTTGTAGIGTVKRCHYTSNQRKQGSGSSDGHIVRKSYDSSPDAISAALRRLMPSGRAYVDGSRNHAPAASGDLLPAR